MATYYIDLVNGNDSADGSTFALGGLPTVGPWLTVTGGATTARIAAGDEIRISKSDDPTSLGMTATWTNGSATVTLNSAKTLNVEQAITGWTAATNVTASTSTLRKIGATSVSLAIADAFTTGKVGYKGLGSTVDFSSYQQVSFWFRTSTAQAASVFSLKLCSDTTGDVAVNTINIPATAAQSSGNYMHVITVDTGGALGASIQSVALYANSDPGIVTCLINNIVACKAPGSDAITLSSLLGKSNTVGSEWYCIQSIDGTTVKLDSYNFTAASTGYPGTTETVTTYKRETFKPAVVSASTSPINSVLENGSINSPISYIGGWNTSNTTRDGETFFDGSNFYGAVFNINGGYDYNKFSYFGFVRVNMGFRAQTTGRFVTVENCSFTNISSEMLGTEMAIVNNCKFYYSGNSNSLATASYAIIKNCTFLAFSSTVLRLGGLIWIENCTFTDCTSLGIANLVGDYAPFAINMINCTMDITTPVSFTTIQHESYVNMVNVDNTTGNNWVYKYTGTANWQTTTFQGSDPGSWKMVPNTTKSNTTYPFKLKIAEVAVIASVAVTITAWVKKDHATNVGGRLVVYANTVVGPSTEQADTKADDTNWEQLSVSFTPSIAGVVPVYVEAWYSAGASNVYVGSITVSQ